MPVAFMPGRRRGSIMGLMMLAASKGCGIKVQASGPQAEAAMEALSKLVTDNFGEE